MKATIALPDDLMREVEIRAAWEGRMLEDLLAEAIRAGLDAVPAAASAEARSALPMMKLATAPGEARTLSLLESCELVKVAG